VALTDSIGTSSTKVVTPGSPWPEPTPRMNGKLRRRLENSTKCTFGARREAWATEV
jgi:hypothetical protein